MHLSLGKVISNDYEMQEIVEELLRCGASLDAAVSQQNECSLAAGFNSLPVANIVSAHSSKLLQKHLPLCS